MAFSNASIRTYGGHRSGEGSSVAEAAAASAAIDRRLVELLGGVPRAPRRDRPRGQVVVLPSPVDVTVRRAA